MGFPIDTAFRSHADENAAENAVEGAVRNAGAEAGASKASSRHVEYDGVAPVELRFGRWSRWVAVAGGFGYFPIAPGTAGSVAGVLLFGAILVAASGLSPPGFLALYSVGVGLLALLGIRAAGRAEVDFGRRDDGRIVIDEVVGQLVGLAPLAVVLASRMPFDPRTLVAGGDSFVIFLEVVTAFVLFRLFDVWKPGAVRWAERRFQGGMGVMADDVVAGAHAALGLFLIHALVFERLLSSSSSTSSLTAGVKAGAGVVGRWMGGLG